MLAEFFCRDKFVGTKTEIPQYFAFHTSEFVLLIVNGENTSDAVVGGVGG